MILSQYDPVSQGGGIGAITELCMQWQIVDHVTKVAHVVNRTLLEHQWDELLNKKSYQCGTAVMRLTQMKSQVVSIVLLAT